MERRAFLKLVPASWLKVTILTGCGQERASQPPSQQVLELLGTAERAYAQAQDLIHWPARYADARPMLESAIEAAAEAWLRDRGVAAKPKSHYPWLFVACNRRDETTGIAWNEARVALLQVQTNCDCLGRIWMHRDFTGHTRAVLITRARKTLVSALDCTARCIEDVRRETVQRVSATLVRDALPNQGAFRDRAGLRAVDVGQPCGPDVRPQADAVVRHWPPTST